MSIKNYLKNIVIIFCFINFTACCKYIPRGTSASLYIYGNTSIRYKGTSKSDTDFLIWSDSLFSARMENFMSKKLALRNTNVKYVIRILNEDIEKTWNPDLQKILLPAITFPVGNIPIPTNLQLYKPPNWYVYTFSCSYSINNVIASFSTSTNFDSVTDNNFFYQLSTFSASFLTDKIIKAISMDIKSSPQ